MSEKTFNRSLAALIFVISLIVYVMTMAATTSFWDSGEFIATSYILGIPHSPGTPLYVLVGRVFCLLPFAVSVAQKVNLLSAFSAALGILMVYLVIGQVIRFMYGAGKTALERFIRYAGPVAGSFFLMFSDTYWTNASESEVYALSTFVMGLCTLLALRWLKNPSCEISASEKEEIVQSAGKAEGSRLIEGLIEKKKDHSRNIILLIVYLLSLGIGFHLGTVMVYGGIFLMLFIVKEKVFSNFELLVFTFGFGAIVADMTIHKHSGLTVVLLIIFAILVMWTTMSKSRFVLSASLLVLLGISVHLFLLIRSHWDPELDMVDPENWRALYAHLRREQYPPINVMVRKSSVLFQVGQFARYFREQFRLAGDLFLGPLNLGKASIVIPVTLGLYGIVTNFVRDRRTWILNFTNLAINTLGLIILLNFSDQEPRERDYFYGPGFYFFAIFIGIGATAFLMMMLDYAREKGRVLKQAIVPAGILLIILSVIPAGYQWHKHDRSNNYLPRDYAYNMLASLEPDAILVTNGDNDTYPLWYIQNVEKYRTDVRVMNRMLLNTPWYIKQIRDNYPKVPITLTDQQIDGLRPVRSSVDGSIIWVYTRMLDHVIKNVSWKQPIYFGVTVPSEVWQRYSDYLEMEGMVRRLVPVKGRFMVSDFMMARNMGEIYSWRGVLTDEGLTDDSVYKPEDVIKMYQNYSVAAMQLAVDAANANDFPGAVRWGEMAFNISPSFSWGKKEMGFYYIRNGQQDKAIEYYNKLIKMEPGNGDYWVGIAAAYESSGRIDLSLSTLLEGAAAAPDNKDVFKHGFQVAALLGKREDAVFFVKKWVERHPSDREFISLYENIDRVLYEEFGVGADPDSAGER
ncbi:MAG: DUF2723 domain-containing protein [Candidatus Krumholzibacteriota bacterium]|nr:DUF2723 domain-containing protein [Candidatus Krumholzibacteriota bacterium]